MAEVVLELDYEVVDAAGRRYFANVAAAPTPGGTMWEAWLEFLPLDDSDPLLTPTETTQTTRAAVAHWASALGEAYVQGAFDRARPATSTRLAATVPFEVAAVDDVAILDPFAVFQDRGREGLRARLRGGTRAELATIIDVHGLNPARLSLARLSSSQLVTFILTATEVQLRGRLSE